MNVKAIPANPDNDTALGGRGRGKGKGGGGGRGEGKKRKREKGGDGKGEGGGGEKGGREKKLYSERIAHAYERKIRDACAYCFVFRNC
jgi:hypothetical protein